MTTNKYSGGRMDESHRPAKIHYRRRASRGISSKARDNQKV